SSSSLAQGAQPTIVIRAGTLLDGKGAARRDVVITVRGATIESVRAATADDNADYDLRGQTVLPGLIDAHVHLGWYINTRGALHRASDGDSPEQAILAGAGNAYTTLMAGVTTVQSVGGREDVPLRDAINRGEIPGPRVLTSIVQLSDTRL